MTRVKSGSMKGGKARPVVDLVIGIGGNQHTVTASVEDRGHMDYPLSPRPRHPHRLPRRRPPSSPTPTRRSATRRAKSWKKSSETSSPVEWRAQAADETMTSPEQQLDANSRPVDGGLFGWQRAESAEDAASRPPREDRSDIRIALVGAAQ